MTDHVEDIAQERLSAAERDLARKRKVSLGETFLAFLRHPSPWMISVFLVGTLTGRVIVGDWQLDNVWAPLVFVAGSPGCTSTPCSPATTAATTPTRATCRWCSSPGGR